MHRFNLQEPGLAGYMNWSSILGSWGTDTPTNNTGEIEALGRALGWLCTVSALDGEAILVSDSSHALATCQALQRCSANVRLVHTVRRSWRREAEHRSVRALHVRGH